MNNRDFQSNNLNSPKNSQRNTSSISSPQFEPKPWIHPQCISPRDPLSIERFTSHLSPTSNPVGSASPSRVNLRSSGTQVSSNQHNSPVYRNQHVMNQSQTRYVHSPLFPHVIDQDEDFEEFQSFLGDNEDIYNDNDENDRELDIHDQSVRKLIQDMGQMKAEFYIRHSIAFFLVFLVLSRLFADLLDNRSCFKEIFMVLYAYLCYTFLEEINLCRNYKTSDQDTKIHYIYAGLDVVSLICSLVILHLKFLKILPPGKAASMPGLVICTLFYFSSYQRKSAKTMFLVKRMMETIQIYLIEAKIDGGINVSWKFLLAYAWIYIAFRILMLIEGLKFAKALIPTTSRKATILFNIWHYTYIVLLLSVLVIYFGYSQVYDSKGDAEFLKSSLTGGQYCSALLFCFTMLMKPFLLMIFSRASSMDYQYTEFGETILDPLNMGISRELREANSNVYFSMISPTYYQLLNQRISPKNAQRLRDLMRFISKNKQLIQFIIKNKVKQIKEGVFSNGETDPQGDGPKDTSSSQAEILRIPLRLAYELNRALIQRILMILSKNPTSIGSLDLDIGELDSYKSNIQQEPTKDVAQEIQKRSNEERTCYICFQNVADGIIMECGHGGFCYDCAIKYTLGKGQCMACRGFARSVARIDNEPLFDNVFKGYMIGRVMLMVNSERCKWILN